MRDYSTPGSVDQQKSENINTLLFLSSRIQKALPPIKQFEISNLRGECYFKTSAGSFFLQLEDMPDEVPSADNSDYFAF